MPTITRTNCNKSDKVMYCISNTPISEGEIVTAYRVMTTPYKRILFVSVYLVNI